MNDLSLKNIDWLSLLVVALPFCRIIKFLPGIPIFLYYGILLFVGIILLTKGQNVFNKKTILFIFFCAVSLIVNNVDPRYRAWERVFSLFCIIMAVGPLFSNKFTYLFRENCIKYTCWFSIIICIISFLLFITVPSLTFTERGNLYGGVTSHSMIMGPLAGIAFIYGLQFYLTQKDRLNVTQRTCWILVNLICLFNCVMAGSRSALLSMIIAAIIWLWFYLSDNRKSFFKYLFIIALITSVTSPLWWQYTETIQHKMEYAESKGSMLSSRQGKWDARIKEIKHAPIFGLGFGTVDAPVSDRGTVEPGNGWLFVWSSSGIFAFVLFCIIYWNSLKQCLTQKSNFATLTFVLLIYIAIHLNAEGYSISSGSIFCFMMWLCFGASYDFKFYSE